MFKRLSSINPHLFVLLTLGLEMPFGEASYTNEVFRLKNKQETSKLICNINEYISLIETDLLYSNMNYLSSWLHVLQI